jgi:hypothetical protein
MISQAGAVLGDKQDLQFEWLMTELCRKPSNNAWRFQGRLGLISLVMLNRHAAFPFHPFQNIAVSGNLNRPSVSLALLIVLSRARLTEVYCIVSISIDSDDD